MHQTPTNPHRVHRSRPLLVGQQFTMDAYSHTVKSLHGFMYCDLLTCLASRQVFPVFTKNRNATELCTRISSVFNAHPEWKQTGEPVLRFIRIDPELNYHSEEFRECMHGFGYIVEKTPPRDKHAGGIAERQVGLITAKANIAMLSPTPPTPGKYWDAAMAYACVTQSFNYNSQIDTSPYHFTTGQHVDLNMLHPFWARCYVFIPLKNRNSKLGSPRAYRAHFIGYTYTTTLIPNYLVIEVLASGTYGKIRTSKDVIFDQSINFTKNIEADIPSDSDFALLHQNPPDIAADPPDIAPPVAMVPAAGYGLPIDDHAPYNPPQPPVPAVDYAAVDYPAMDSPIEDFPARVSPAPNIPVLDPADEPYHYWFSTEHFMGMAEVKRHPKANVVKRDPRVPKTFTEAIAIPVWAEAIDKELKKFEVNDCFRIVPYTGQHRVPMMWLFSIKTDGTHKARLVCRGDLMIPFVDFDPRAVFCTNISACSIKMALSIAAKYGLIMRGGDLVGAYLVTRGNKQYPVFIFTPQGYTIKPNQVIEAVGNIYGAPPAGQNFSLEFDRCMKECGYSTTVYDEKFFFKWVDSQICLVIAHSDDFRWFGPQELLCEWDMLVATFNAHKYEVTDCTDKEFVGIRIYHDDDFNYYMDQTRMINTIVSEAGISGASDSGYHLPYPMTGESLSKLDNATDEERPKCSLYPYRKVVGQLMYGMVHTMVCIMYALNVLSRYSNNPGPRHIDFIKHLLRYVKYSKADRLMFKCHKGPKDIKTMTSIMQLHFQCDADLGGNLDNHHSQTSFLGYLGGDLICWCSTDQGSISTSTAESEIKAVNHTLKSEVISNRGILNAMGWMQEPTVIEEDNSACVAASNVTHMTRNLRHLDLSENWFKEKVADKTCVLVKVESRYNNSDIGTKRVPQSLFNALTHDLVDRNNRDNL